MLTVIVIARNPHYLVCFLNQLIIMGCEDTARASVCGVKHTVPWVTRQSRPIVVTFSDQGNKYCLFTFPPFTSGNLD